jgi:hypothetical protein
MKLWLFFLIANAIASTIAFAATNEHRLSEFYSGDSIVRLQGQYDEFSVSLPLSSVAVVENATLNLRTVNSRALVKNRSLLVVRFNNATIGQIQYDPEVPFANSDIVIPNQLWREGFNNLTFAVSQHYTDQCEEHSAPELWSEVDMNRSSLSITTKINDETKSLQSLSGFFNPGLGAQDTVTLFTSSSEQVDLLEDTLPLIAQGLALRNQYRPLNIEQRVVSTERETVSSALINGEFEGDGENALNDSAWYLGLDQESEIHVLIGTADALSPYLSQAQKDNITGPYLQVQAMSSLRLDDNILAPKTYRLIVSGVNLEELKIAAHTLAVMDDALNPSQQLIVQDQAQNTTSSLLKNHTLSPDNTYSFLEMGIQNERFRDEREHKQKLSFNLPADFYVPESASVILLLDFDYSAGVGPSSIMGIGVNGKLIHGLALDNKNGQVYSNYELRIPARLFKGGINNIELAVTLRRPISEFACAQVMGSHMTFNLYSTSHMVLPEATNAAVQPNLALFGETAFPLAKYNMDSVSSVYIAEPQMSNGALTLIGKLAQVSKSPILGLSLKSGIPSATNSSAIILATPDNLQDLEQDGFPSAIEKTNSWPYRMQNALRNRIHEVSGNKPPKTMKVQNKTVQASSLGEMAVLIAQQGPSPSESNTLFVIAAATPSLVNERIQDLVSLSLWGQLAGDLFAWDSFEKPLIVMQVNDQFVIGDKQSPWMSIRIWLSNNPWYWLVAVLLVIMLISALVFISLKRRNQRLVDSW